MRSALLLLLLAGCIVEADESAEPRQLIFQHRAAPAIEIAENATRIAETDQEVLTGVVVAIADGDTLTVLDATKTQHKIRLEGIDTPEKGQAFGTRAREALGEKVHEQAVRVEWKERDRYGRTLGHVYLDKRWLNQEMIEEGWGWHYKQYNRDGRLADAEVRARSAKRGLWADADPVAPWEFRRRQRTPVAAPFASDETLVYVTPSGQKYHLQSCRHLSANVKAIPLGQARERYSACKGCNPPE